MHAPTALLLALTGFAAAQTSSSSSTSSTSTPESGCGESIDLIIQSCLATTRAQLDACATQDWDCLCEQSNNVLTCYNNCPSDPNRFGVEQTKVANCNAASAYGTQSASATRSSSGSPATLAPGTTPTGTTANTVTSSSAAPSASSSQGFDSGAAGTVGVGVGGPAAGIAAAMVGLVVLV